MDINQLKQADFGEQFGRLFSQITHHYHAWAKSHGLNYSQWTVLCSLYYHAPITQKAICDEWILPKQTVFTICKQYLADGVIAFKESQDKREKLLVLTEKGQALAAPIMQDLEQSEAKVFTHFGWERSRQLLVELAEMERVFRGKMLGS